MNKEVVERWIQGTMEASVEETNPVRKDYFGGNANWLEPEIDPAEGATEARTVTDRYAGVLMSESNKMTLRNIQLRQLARDHPHMRDFYHLTVEIRKANQQSNQGEVMKLMGKLYPLRRLDNGLEDDMPRPSPFSEETLSKCLGTLKINSTGGPKTVLEPDLIDGMKQTAAPINVSAGLKSNLNSAQQRHVLIQIELLYRYLLDYEEAEGRISVLRYRSDYDMNMKKQSLQFAKEIVLKKSLLRNMLSVDKGKMVVCRLLTAFTPAVATKVLSFFVDLIPEWKFDADKKAHKIYTCFSYCICESIEGDLKIIVEKITEDLIRQLTTSELGMSFLMLILNQGQDLCTQSQVKSGNLSPLWTNFLKSVSAIVGSLESLCVPYEIFPAFTENLKRDETVSDDLRELWIGLQKIFCDNGAIITSDT